ncbi:MAG: YhfC family intramembrane metalloprotease [Clostridiaceae bacterium]|nr:YhfC family intramembrane metalloprotease [Clostridiaceae bacterium]
MVSISVMNYLMEIAVISFVIPMVVLLAWRLRTHKNMMPALIGAGIYLLSRLICMMPNTLILGINTPVSKYLNSNPVLLCLYLGIIAAITQQLGRYIAFRFFMKKYPGRDTAVSYGIGHAAIECILVIGWTDLQYYMQAALLNQGTLDKVEGSASLIASLQKLTTGGLVLDALAGAVFFVTQIGLSILVFQAVRNEKLRLRLMLYAMIFHVAAYLPDGLYQQQWISHSMAFILQIFVMASTMFLAVDIFRRMGENEKQIEKEEKKKQAQENAKKWAIASQKLTNLSEKNSSKNEEE